MEVVDTFGQGEPMTSVSFCLINSHFDNRVYNVAISISKWVKTLLIVMGFRNASVLRVIITLLYCAGVLKAVIGSTNTIFCCDF